MRLQISGSLVQSRQLAHFFCLLFCRRGGLVRVGVEAVSFRRRWVSVWCITTKHNLLPSPPTTHNGDLSCAFAPPRRKTRTPPRRNMTPRVRSPPTKQFSGLADWRSRQRARLLELNSRSLSSTDRSVVRAHYQPHFSFFCSGRGFFFGSACRGIGLGWCRLMLGGVAMATGMVIDVD
jgi:hypothetical protein